MRSFSSVFFHSKRAMIRVFVISACCANASSQRYFCFTVPLLCGSTKDNPSSNTPLYYNQHTWPKHWAASDIQKLLEGHLLDPSEAPNHELMECCLAGTNMIRLQILVRTKIKPPPRIEVDVDSAFPCLLHYCLWLTCV